MCLECILKSKIYGVKKRLNFGVLTVLFNLTLVSPAEVRVKPTNQSEPGSVVIKNSCDNMTITSWYFNDLMFAFLGQDSFVFFSD